MLPLNSPCIVSIPYSTIKIAWPFQPWICEHVSIPYSTIKIPKTADGGSEP